MIAISQLIEVTHDKYFILKMFKWNHYLLKYFTVDKDGSFLPSDVLGVEEEFVGRFRGNSLSIRDVVKSEKRITYEDYQTALFSNCFKNYISALEDAIIFAEKMN